MTFVINNRTFAKANERPGGQCSPKSPPCSKFFLPVPEAKESNSFFGFFPQHSRCQGIEFIAMRSSPVDIYNATLCIGWRCCFGVSPGNRSRTWRMRLPAKSAATPRSTTCSQSIWNVHREMPGVLNTPEMCLACCK